MNFTPVLKQLVAHYFANIYLNTGKHIKPKMDHYPLLGTEEIRFQNLSEFH
jgi:hypothetical protein